MSPATAMPGASPADADVELVPATVALLAFFSAGRFPKPDLLGQCSDGQVVPISGRELVERVRDFGLGLGTLGTATGDRVGILSESRPEWIVADLAILASGAVTVPVYPTLLPEQIAFILRDSGANLVIASSQVQVDKLLALAPSLPALRTIVSMDAFGITGGDASTSPPADAARAGTVILVSLAEVMAAGHRRILDGWGVGREFHDGAKRVQPDDLATIVYTSGTTGDPKGVMLTHANLIANLTGVLQVLDPTSEDVALSFLPLCHAFERIVAYVYLASGVSMIFAQSFDTISRDLLLVRPTVMTGVPRVFEKLHARVLEKGHASGLVRGWLFDWAARVADRRGQRASRGSVRDSHQDLRTRIADRLVFSRIRQGLGGRLRYAVSGSAPLREDIARFFYGIGFPILEGYGLTETSPVLSVMPLDGVRFGTVGRPLPNVEIAVAADGEVLARGPNVMRGYYQRPAETSAVLAEGWFHTGDVGTLDTEGYLRITDRKKELILTSGGKKIAPQPIEARLVADPLVAEAVVVGEGRHFPALLLVPDFPALAARLGVDVGAARRRVADADVRALYQPVVEAVNASLAQFERIKKFAVLADDFSMATGELTPTLKVKRRVIEKKYRDVVEQLYS